MTENQRDRVRPFRERGGRDDGDDETSGDGRTVPGNKPIAQRGGP